MKLNEAISEFLIAIAADGVASSTTNWYSSLLAKFAADVGDMPISTISTKQIRLFLIAIQPVYSSDTLHAHKRALHKFWTWCASEYGTDNPMKNIAYPSPPKRTVPKAANIQDISRLFEAIDETTSQGKRDAALFCFLADTGCRSGGAAGLLMSNLDLSERRAYVVEKGDKTRAVYFTTYTLGKIEAWLEVRPNVDYVFINLRTYQPLTSNGIYELTKRYKERLGIKGKLNPHSFRHAFAREYLKNGGDLKTLSEILGHASIEVTADIYSIFLPDELQHKHKKHTPMNQIAESMESLDKGQGE